jgi:hypothetical protein
VARIVIPTVYGYLVVVIDAGGKRYFCLRAGLSCRGASSTVGDRAPKIKALLYFPFMSYITCADLKSLNTPLY